MGMILFFFLNNIISKKIEESTENNIIEVSELNVEKYNYDLINNVKLFHTKNPQKHIDLHPPL